MILQKGIVLTGVFFVCSFLLLLYNFSSTRPAAKLREPSQRAKYSTTLVVSQCCKQSIKWVEHTFRDLDKAIYSLDGSLQDGARSVATNRSSVEPIAFLEYVIDHYDQLPDVSVFVHAHASTWHQNDLLGFSTSSIIARLNLAHVMKQGYQPLRCEHAPGCGASSIDLNTTTTPLSSDIDLYAAKAKDDFQEIDQSLFRKAWRELHGDAALPARLAAPAYSQFAVTRPMIRSMSLERWMHYRQWVEETPLPNTHVARVFEYMWQYLFLGEGEHCPDVFTCACDGFAVCFQNATTLGDWMEMREKQAAMHEDLMQMGSKPNGSGTPEYKDLAFRTQAMGAKIQKRLLTAKARGDYGRSNTRLYLPLGIG